MKSTLLLCLVAIVCLCGCGKDGKDGNVYLQISIVATPFSYADNNPGIPDPFYIDTYYRCNPGTYNYGYTSWDYSTWYGTYTLSANKGTKGGFLKKGDDGADRYYTLFCYSSGAYISGAPQLDSTAYLNESSACSAAGAAKVSPQPLRKNGIAIPQAGDREDPQLIEDSDGAASTSTRLPK
jgi:hypothetical protein